MKRRYFVFITVFFVVLGACRSASVPSAAEAPVAAAQEDAPEEEPPELDIPADIGTLPVSSFGEIWGCLPRKNLDSLEAGIPLTDLVYYGAEVDMYGKLVDVPDPGEIARFPGKKHLAVQCESRALSHFVLLEGSQTRKELVSDILAAVKGYDGLQIDFELIPARDGAAFRSFLTELRGGLGNKTFSIALPARTRVIANDVYDYGLIVKLVDRILVMAYDEHWSTSAPGSIASMNWCRRVAAHARTAIGPEKLIMGLPFYGRSWGETNYFKAYFHSGIERIKRENNISEIRRENGVPNFSYEVPFTITVYYEDDYSLSVRMEMYRNMGVKRIGFWAIGQESPTVWNYMKAENGRP